MLLTGLRAKSLAELLRLLYAVPGSAIFYHTHHMYLSHHFETPVFSNDFALWVSEALQDEALGERLAGINLLAFTSVRQLRKAIIQTMERHPGDNDRNHARRGMNSTSADRRASS